MLKQLTLSALTLSIPLTTLTLAGAYHFSPAYLDHSFTGGFPALLTAFSSLCAVYCFGLILLFFFINERNKTLDAKNRALENAQSELIAQSKNLAGKIDLLSATREISLIITHEVDFRKILSKALEIISQSINSSFESRPGDGRSEITIFLKDEISGRLKASAKYETPPHQEDVQVQLKNSAITFDESLPERLDWRNVNESLEHSRLFFSADGEMLDFTIPLMADHDAVGVLKVKIPAWASANRQQTENDIKRLQDNLTELARVLALAVKTPMLYNRAITDGLTGLYTKRHLLTELSVYLEISRRHATKLSFVMIDIDHFKQVNDTHGHLTGDSVLKAVSETLQKTLRATSTAYRYGGEEIAVILPLSSRQDARTFAERLRKKIETQHFTSPSGHKFKVTISLGVAEYDRSMPDFKELISRADTALYRAKQSGRNQTAEF